MAKSKKKPVKKAAAKKPVKKAAVKKASPKKTVAKKAAPKKKAVPQKKSVTKKAAPKKAPQKKAAVKPVASKKPALFVAPKAAKKINLSNFVTPLDDRVLVQIDEAERMTPGGLYIPNTVSDVSGNLQGLVVSVGRGRLDKKGRVHPMDLQVGDKVVFTEHAGNKIKIEEHDLIFLRESDVLGVVG